MKYVEPDTPRWWHIMLILMAMAMGYFILFTLFSCKQTSKVTSSDTTFVKNVVVRDTTITVPRYQLSATYDTLPIGIPITKFDSSGAAIQLLRDELGKIHALANIPPRVVHLPGVMTHIRDTIKVTKIIENREKSGKINDFDWALIAIAVGATVCAVLLIIIGRKFI